MLASQLGEVQLSGMAFAAAVTEVASMAWLRLALGLGVAGVDPDLV